MKKFEFRLEKLLRVRLQAEKVKKQGLAAIRCEIEREEAKLERLNRSKGVTFDELRTHSLQETLDIPGVLHCYCRLQAIDENIQVQKTAINTLGQEEALKRQAVIAARRDRKVVENLKERAHARHLKEVARLEQRFLDEIGLIQYIKEGGDGRNESSVLG